MDYLHSLFDYLPLYLWKNTDINNGSDKHIFCIFKNPKYFKLNETIDEFKKRHQITQKLFINKIIPRKSFVSYSQLFTINKPKDNEFLDETKTFAELGIKPNDHIIIYDL